MMLHMLLLPENRETMPETIKVKIDWGEASVIFDHEKIFTGLHCFVEGTREEIVKWLHPFDLVIIGNGSPQSEKFQIMHVSEEALEKIGKS